VELAPDEVVQSDRPVAVLIDEVQLVAQGFLLLIRVLQSVVLEEQNERDVREPAPLALDEPYIIVAVRRSSS
jgi:hypothetical protein